MSLVFDDLASALEASGVGSIFERVAHGWKVKFVDGGTSIVVEGPTITEALASHGAQIVHPVKVVPEGIVEVELVDERRSPDQDAALEEAFIAAKLPEEDRRGKKSKRGADGA